MNGKSIFYAYFFRRYSVEQPLVTVITASYTQVANDDILTNVVMWRGGKVVDEASIDESAMRQLMLDTMRGAKDRVLYLCDGTAPRRCPSNIKMVYFTSPRKQWFCQNAKDQNQSELVMPLWNVEELRAAASELDLVTYSMVRSEKSFTVADLVEQRYYIFGGIARECLSPCADFVKARQQSIENIAKRFNRVDNVRNILDQSEGEEERHMILHHAPSSTHLLTYSIADPPIFVKRLLIECWSRLFPSERKEVIQYLRLCSGADSLRGTLFELGVHEKLNAGCGFTARSLGKGTTWKKFSCKKSMASKMNQPFCYFDRYLSASVLSSGPYHVPSARNFTSTDSFYYNHSKRFSQTTTDRLLLFQITVEQTCYVNGQDLKLLLESLGLLNAVKENPQRCAIIFVVLGADANAFVLQDIEWKLSNNELSLEKSLKAIPQFVWGAEVEPLYTLSRW